MLGVDQIVDFRHGDLRFAFGNLRVYPLAIGSGHGTVRGGISRTAEHPLYFEHLRSSGGRESSITRWRHKDPSALPTKGVELPVNEGVAVYLGPAHRHFGHFAVESLSRAWMAHLAGGMFDRSKIRFVVLPELTDTAQRGVFKFDDLLPWQIDIYNAIGVTKHNTSLVTQPERFTQLIVPEQAVLYGGAYHSDAAKIVSSSAPDEAIARLWPRNQRKIFLTRGYRYLQSGYIAGTNYIAYFFSKNGYIVVDNENISALKQISWARNAEIVMAIQSSSMHVYNIFGNASAKLGYLRRLNAKLDQGMVDSLRGLVDITGALESDECMEFPDIKQLRERMCVFRDLTKLKKFFADFDPALDLKKFDDGAYLNCVRQDIDNLKRATGQME